MGADIGPGGALPAGTDGLQKLERADIGRARRPVRRAELVVAEVLTEAAITRLEYGPRRGTGSRAAVRPTITVAVVPRPSSLYELRAGGQPLIFIDAAGWTLDGGAVTTWREGW